jgi:branched-chain amino acid transport system substrate-binding protein
VRTRRAGAIVALALLSLACGTVPPGPIGNKGEIVIASDFPTSGAIRASGRGPEAGVAYAIQTAVSIKGFKLTHMEYDDAVNGAQDPQRGAQNFNDIVGDNRVLGVVGPFNSNVARATIPIANKAELAMVNPSNTHMCLTLSFDWCDKKPVEGAGVPPASALRDPSKPNNYFRLVASDLVQGTAMADFAIDALKVSKAAVWSDSLPFFGKVVADMFTKRFQSRGGTVVARQDFDAFSKSTDFRPFFQRAKDAGAQAVFVGAVVGTGACIARAQSKGILDVPYLGPDGMGENQCIKDAGDQATENMYFTIASPAADRDPGNKGLIDAFKTAYSQQDDLSAYTFVGYDAARILIDAIGRAIDAAGGGLPTRRQVLDAVQNTKNLKLSTGTYSFDKNGDATTPTMAFYQLKNGVWTFIKQFSVPQ